MADRPYLVSYKPSKSRRMVRLMIHSDSEVIVYAPKEYSKRTLSAFLDEKEAWILKQLKKRKRLIPHKAALNYEEGGLFYYLGQPYTICYSDRKDVPLLFDQNKVFFPAKARPHAFIKKWISDRCEDIILDRVAFFEQQMNLKSYSVSFRFLKSRWGSCSSQGHLLFNKHLIQCPLDIIDYVVIHELSHLVHMNHSEAFWQQVAIFYPEYKQAKKWLKDHVYLFL